MRFGRSRLRALALPGAMLFVPWICYGQGVSFSQENWSFPGASGDGPASTGQIDVNIGQLISATGMNSGFLNVTTSAGWVVQNLPILQGFNYQDVSTTFNLNVPSGTVDASPLNAAVEFTSMPQTGDALSPSSNFCVGQEGFDAEGQGANEGAAPFKPAGRCGSLSSRTTETFKPLTISVVRQRRRIIWTGCDPLTGPTSPLTR